MAVAKITYTFAPLTDIKSAEANQNFADLVSFLNGQVIHKDGSVAFTAVPSGPAVDPVSDNQFTRKAYVDRREIIAQQALTTATATFSATTDTDMQLNNVPVVAGHTYGIHLHTGVDAGGSGTGRFDLVLLVNGVENSRFGIVYGNFGVRDLDAMVYWTAPSTQATDDFRIRVKEVINGATISLLAGAPSLRFFTILGFGVI